MTSERWQKINELYHDALELEANRQATFLDQACVGDTGLRDEVKSLIASHDLAGSFLAESALKAAARVLAEDRAAALMGRSFSHYRIESLLGVGGMGEVYLAEDTRLDRKVAVKVLDGTFSRHESNLLRFIHEAKAASALNHPNILIIHEIGVTEDANYIVSEFVDGTTLRDVITTSPLTLSQVLDISLQVAAALCTAHEAHLVHCDIKPENIMIRADGLLKILDFGLAKLVVPTSGSILRSEDYAAKGQIWGTISYMSPEQAKGEPVDERTDIFSLGVMIHEMIVGRTPFAGDTPSETFDNLVNTEPQPLSIPATDRPDELQRIIFRTLHKERDERYQTMKELLADLKTLKEHLAIDEQRARSASTGDHVPKGSPATPDRADPQSAGMRQGFSRTIERHKPLTALVLAALLAGAIGLGYSFFGPGKTTSVPDGKRSIAVLPLKPLDIATRDDIYEMGIADSLILTLGSLEGLIVRPLSATRRYAGVDQDPMAAGREQKVDYVLATTYQVTGGRLRVTSRLFNVANGQIDQAYDTDKDAANVFATQDAIAGEIGRVLAARFGMTSSVRTAKRGTTNEEAYRLYLQGMYLNSKRNPADAQKAVELLEQAVRLDANYARAWAGKAHAHTTNFTANPKAGYQQSMDAIGKALALDENLADAHSVLCANKTSYEWDFAGAERECKRAVELDPNSSLAHLNYARYLNTQGHFDAAIHEVKIAIDLAPASLETQRAYGTLLYHARRYPEAVTQLKRVIAMDEKFGTTYNWLVVALEMQGNYPEAFEWWMKKNALYKVPEEAIRAYQAAYRVSGYRGLMLERTSQCDRESFRRNYKGVYFQGAIEHAKAGNKNQAFRYLEQSYLIRESWMNLVRVEPGLDSLRDDPRFDPLVKRVGLR